MYTGHPMDSILPFPTSTREPHAVSEYGLHNPLEIGSQLRNLASRADLLTVNFSGGQVVTQILHVDVHSRVFTFDAGSLTERNDALSLTPQCMFQAAPDGVRVEFLTATPRQTRYEDRTAFEADFPEVLYHVQRREFFRIETPIAHPYSCQGKLPAGDTFSFEVHDLSLGGVALRTFDERATKLQLGTRLPGLELNLGSNGPLPVTLQLVSLRAVPIPNGKQFFLLGFRFLDLPGTAEKLLQRVITQLEMKRR